MVLLNQAEGMEAQQTELQKNREAESAWTRKHLWDSDEMDSEDENGEMRTTILGDVSLAAPETKEAVENVRKGAAWLLPFVLGMAIPGAAGLGAAAAMLLSQERPVEKQTFEDETVQIKLGKLEDYLGRDSE